MEQILLFTTLGLGSGALIAGLGISLVATYRGSGTINFAAGAIAMFAAYTYYGLNVGGYLLFPGLYIAGGEDYALQPIPSIVITLLACAVVGVGMHFLVLRPLRRQSALAKLVGTVGVLLILQAYIVLAYGALGYPAPFVIPSVPMQLFGGIVPSDRWVLFGIVIVLTVGLTLVYRFTRFGVATRAAQESEVEAALSGLSASRLGLINTIIATLVAGLFGIVIAPLTQLDPRTIALAVVPALGAALLARFTSFVTVAAAGIGMGILASLASYAQTQSWFPNTNGVAFPGITDLLYFVIIVVALLWRGQSLPDRGTIVEPRLPRAPAPKHLVRPGLIAAAVVAVALFVLPFDLRQALIITLIGGVACLSLVILTGFVGQVSIFQFGVAGIAGIITSKLGTVLGIGWPWAPLIGIVGAVLMGLLLALPALRVRGVQLAILTLAGAVALSTFGFGNPIWGNPAVGSPVADPEIFGFGIGPTSPVEGLDGARPSPLFGLAALLVLLLCGFLVGNIRRSRIGKRMLAVRSNERAAAGAGISPSAIKLIAFGISAAIMGIAGLLYSYNFGNLDPSRFQVINTLSLVAFAYLGGITTVRGAVMGGVIISQGFVSYLLNHYVGISVTFQLLVAGVLLVVTIIANPDGIALAPPPRFVRRILDRIRGRRPEPADAAGAGVPERSVA